MTKPKPTPEQIKRACDLSKGYWPRDYNIHGNTAFVALADTIAELDAEKARADKAVADLRGIDRIAVKLGWDKACHIAGENILAVAAIAAPYRVETDPLVAALQAMEWTSVPATFANRLRAELAKRGIPV